MMEEVKELTKFYSAVKDDNRLGTSHISLYMALFQLYNMNGFCNPVFITRGPVMELAKISGLATYHKCMKDLHQYGYIQYQPSYNPAISSQVTILNCESKPTADPVVLY